MTRKPFGPARRLAAAGTLVMALAMVLAGAAPAGAIVGGNPTTPSQYPYYVQVRVYKYSDASKYAVCGGSVIAKAWILTAAHCMTGGKTQIRVDVLVHDTYHYDAIELKIHPLWNGSVDDGHDLALLRLPGYATEAGGGIPEATKVQVGSPTDTGAYAAGVIATMVGHGATSGGGSGTKELRDLHTPLHSDGYMDDIYNKWYWFDHWINSLMIGAGWSNHTACNGDSGGPLTVDRNGVRIQVGVASFATTGCDEPAGYAELSGPQLAWVAATVPAVATKWGSCAANNGTTPGRWQATYVEGTSGGTRDGRFEWKISCVPSYPDTASPDGSSTGPRGGYYETGSYQEPSPTPAPTRTQTYSSSTKTYSTK